MQPSTVERRREQITFPGLPLAVYREVAAHLRQVEGIKTGLIPQQSQEFDYHQSQVSGLWIEYVATLDPSCLAQVAEILDYYAQWHGSWKRE